MRPYFALIKDSFRAAISSSVLYVLLGVITLLLLALAPLHIVEILDWKLVPERSVPNTEQLAQAMVERSEDEAYPAAMRIWEKLPSDDKAHVKKWVDFLKDESTISNQDERTMFLLFAPGKVTSALNEIIKDEDFYDEAVWKGKRLNREATALIDEGVESLSRDRVKRLNRLLVANAYPVGVIRKGADTALDLRYAIWQWENLNFTMPHNMFADLVKSTVNGVFDWVLWIGIFIAILVTANIIPETFLPGSLNLLLSKPVSRTGLLLAKFFGGCAYVTLCIIYLFLGLWLWLGIGMKIWDPTILWGIPLYIAVFAIYYSVSTFVGVWSRSAILSIIVTVLFWAFCFAVGTSHNFARNFLSHEQSAELLQVDDDVLQVGRANAISKWDSSDSKWEEQLEMEMLGPQESAVFWTSVFEDAGAQGGRRNGDPNRLDHLGPVFDSRRGQVVAGMPDMADMSSIRYQNLFVADKDDLRFRKIGKAPRRALKFFSDKEGVLTVDSSGKIYRLNPPTESEEKEAAAAKADNGKADNGNAKNAGKSKDKKKGGVLSRWLKSDSGPFQALGPRRGASTIDQAEHVAFNQQTRAIVTYSRRKLNRFSINDKGKYEASTKSDMEELVDEQLNVLLASAGNVTIACLGNGKVLVFDEDTLELKETVEVATSSRFNSAVASGDGQNIVIKCFDRTAWLLKTSSPNSATRLGVGTQGSITSISFNSDNEIWVGEEFGGAARYDLDSSKQLDSHTPDQGWVATTYRFFLRPFYWACPKPGEINTLVDHLSTNTSDDEEIERNLSRSTHVENPWQPLWGGLVFMGVMLMLSSLLFIRRDY